ncbi:cytochrome P450 [Streptomyces sp. B3I7]|uniref:cytochrome P450 n=1 Tax=Streptomyces sp. B3I7 TaxID=3042269 RepID=UPI00277D2912|nr:cytochrome P450 [Streptomyces sp. B3I7]MDQ0808370.1 cytochrome P450 [Streptomyces sp. B3I7]
MKQAAPIHLRRNRFAVSDQLLSLQSEKPVFPLVAPSGEKIWLVTGYDMIRHILSKPALFGNADRSFRQAKSGTAGGFFNSPPERNGNLVLCDPPDHGRLRRLIGTVFTVKRVQQMRPRIMEIISDSLDGMEAMGPPADLVQNFALPIPARIICELLGVPYEDRTAFQRRSLTRFDATLAMETRLAAEAASLKYMAELVARKRVSPDNTLLGSLIREHGDDLDDQEITGIGDLLLLGGHETTANMLALGSLFLLENVDHAEAVRSGDGIEKITEELLRYLSVVQCGVPRIARTDTVLGGQEIKAGDRLLCSLTSANHDETMTANPEDFDSTREASHLAFGHGIHYCIGAPLARLEMQLAYPALLTRFPDLRPAVPANQIRFRPSSVFYGLQELPVSW